MRRKGRKPAGGLGLLRNLSLTAGSLFVLYAVFELIVFPLSLPYLPYRLHGHVAPPLLMFAQSSKSGRSPKDYIALVGDSYAVGEGDQWRSLDKWSRGSYGSAHLLHRFTGRDVVSFGQGGVGSLGGIAAAPIAYHRYLNRTKLFRIEPPKIILAYFYEGNDLNNNIEEIERRFRGEYAEQGLGDPEVFDRFIEEKVIGENPLMRAAAEFSRSDNLFFLDSCRRLLRAAWDTIRGAPRAAGPGSMPIGELNRVRVGGRVVLVPDGLQSPALDLSEPEIDLGVHVFERSIARLGRAFPEARIYAVHVPSPLSCYELASEKVQIEAYKKGPDIFDSGLVAKRSDLIAAKLLATCRKAGCELLDPRGAIRAAARERLVHGPEDWWHFNRRGYEALVRAIVPVLEKDSAAEGGD